MVDTANTVKAGSEALKVFLPTNPPGEVFRHIPALSKVPRNLLPTPKVQGVGEIFSTFG